MRNQTQITGAEAILLFLFNEDRKRIIGIPEGAVHKQICEGIN
jgi:hypothetical protein